jgi:hypothetical protein
MPFSHRRRPCCCCRKWFRPDPRVGVRQRACSAAACQRRRRAQTQAAWRAANPDYFAARRIQARAASATPPEPLRVRPPLDRLPWDIAQDEFGVQGADFLGVFGQVLVHYAQDQRPA